MILELLYPLVSGIKWQVVRHDADTIKYIYNRKEMKSAKQISDYVVIPSPDTLYQLPFTRLTKAYYQSTLFLQLWQLQAQQAFSPLYWLSAITFHHQQS